MEKFFFLLPILLSSTLIIFSVASPNTFFSPVKSVALNEDYSYFVKALEGTFQILSKWGPLKSYDELRLEPWSLRFD